MPRGRVGIARDLPLNFGDEPGVALREQRPPTRRAISDGATGSSSKVTVVSVT